MHKFFLGTLTLSLALTTVDAASRKGQAHNIRRLTWSNTFDGGSTTTATASPTQSYQYGKGSQGYYDNYGGKGKGGKGSSVSNQVRGMVDVAARCAVPYTSVAHP